jgi:hypothetical protein
MGWSGVNVIIPLKDYFWQHGRRQSITLFRVHIS